MPFTSRSTESPARRSRLTAEHDVLDLDLGLALEVLLLAESSRFGSLELDASQAIQFPAGLIGLGGHAYVLLRTGDDSSFSWLQSLEDPELALPVTNPWQFFADYVVDLSDEHTERVGDAAVDVWVTVRTGSELSDFRANLRAPILVANGVGYQVINEAPDVPVRAPLFDGALAGQAA